MLQGQSATTASLPVPPVLIVLPFRLLHHLQDMNGLIMKILRGSFLPLPPHYSSDLRAMIGKLLAKASCPLALRRRLRIPSQYLAVFRTRLLYAPPFIRTAQLSERNAMQPSTSTNIARRDTVGSSPFCTACPPAQAPSRRPDMNQLMDEPVIKGRLETARSSAEVRTTRRPLRCTAAPASSSSRPRAAFC